MENTFIKLLASIIKLCIHSIPCSLFFTSLCIWQYIILMRLMQFLLSGLFIKIRLVLFFSSIFIFLTACFRSSLFKKRLFYIFILVLWPNIIYLASNINITIICCQLLDQVIIVFLRKKQYFVIDFLSLISSAQLLLVQPTISSGLYFLC